MAAKPPRLLKDFFNAAKIPIARNQTPKGSMGYDNPRENIDPHIRTKAISTKEIKADTASGFTGIMPIGSIIAWHKHKLNSSGQLVFTEVPENWQECDGAAITDPDSPYVNTNTPNLNGEDLAFPRFLRGNTTSGGTGGADTHNHTFTGSSVSTSTAVLQGAANVAGGAALQAQHTHTVTAEGTVNNSTFLPSYFSVVWIMRIK